MQRHIGIRLTDLELENAFEETPSNRNRYKLSIGAGSLTKETDIGLRE